jgi:hypothetical protein
MLGRSPGTATALHCAARSRGPVAELTSLNFVSLRSNSGDESVHERAARGAASPALLVAPEIAPAGQKVFGSSTEKNQRISKGVCKKGGWWTSN